MHLHGLHILRTYLLNFGRPKTQHRSRLIQTSLFWCGRLCHDEYIHTYTNKVLSYPPTFYITIANNPLRLFIRYYVYYSI